MVMTRFGYDRYTEKRKSQQKCFNFFDIFNNKMSNLINFIK